MILGSAIDGDPAMLLFDSNDGDSWQFASVLYRAPAYFRQGGARCAECPDFFQLDGRWILIAGFVGYTEAETGRHNLIYAVIGDFEGGVFTPASDELQELDFGTDYYAMQSFWDGERQLALAWLFNWEFRKPQGSAYSGELSLPRQLSMKSGKLSMLPEAGVARLRKGSLKWGEDASRRARPRPHRGFDQWRPHRHQNSGYVASGAHFEIAERDGRLFVGVQKMTADHLPLARAASHRPPRILRPRSNRDLRQRGDGLRHPTQLRHHRFEGTPSAR